MNSILFEINHSVATITLNRPDKSNAISRELLEDFVTALLEVEKNPHLRVLIIRGAGEKVFCAGADLKERMEMTEKDVFHFLDRFRFACEVIESISIPVIAAMNGDAYGGGLEIALSCDLRVLSSQALIGLTETKLGIIPGAGGTQRLSRLIGLSKAKQLIFTGSRINAEKAYSLDIANEVYPQADFISKLDGLVGQILSSAPLAVKAAKKAIEEGFSLPLEDALSLERECYLSTLHTKDRNEALLAFKEKRQPVFKGE